MISRLVDILLQRSPRERMLLGLLVIIVLPVLAWVAVVVPVQERRDAITYDFTEAALLNEWVISRQDEDAQLRAILGDAAQVAGPIGVGGIEQTLVSAGLRDDIAELANRSEGAIELRFDAVPFADLVGWLDINVPTWGYDFASFRITQTEDPGVVQAEFSLVPKAER